MTVSIRLEPNLVVFIIGCQLTRLFDSSFDFSSSVQVTSVWRIKQSGTDTKMSMESFVHVSMSRCQIVKRIAWIKIGTILLSLS